MASKDPQPTAQTTSTRPSLPRPSPAGHARNNSHSLIGLSLNSSNRVGRRKSISGAAVSRAVAAYYAAEPIPGQAASPGLGSSGLASSLTSGPGGYHGPARPSTTNFAPLGSGVATTTPHPTVARNVPAVAPTAPAMAGSMPALGDPGGPAGSGAFTRPGISIKTESQDYRVLDRDFPPRFSLGDKGGRQQDHDRHAVARLGLHQHQQNPPDATAQQMGEGPAALATKEARKSGRAELRCDFCGKGYKHSSCLTKHLWEHTPGWSYTSKLLISKHQQVQLLEAASVLVAIKDAATTPPESAKDFNSDTEPYSPAASTYDGPSSAEMTPSPPPHADEGFGATFAGSAANAARENARAFDFARSYASVPSPNSPFATSVTSGGFGQETRPISSGRNHTGADDQDLAAAVKLLSCSHRSGAVQPNNRYAARTPWHDPASANAPTMPTSLLSYDGSMWSGGARYSSVPGWQPESFVRGEARVSPLKTREADSPMEEDDDEDAQSRARSEEDDHGVFGEMEE